MITVARLAQQGRGDGPKTGMLSCMVTRYQLEVANHPHSVRGAPISVALAKGVHGKLTNWSLVWPLQDQRRMVVHCGSHLCNAVAGILTSQVEPLCKQVF